MQDHELFKDYEAAKILGLSVHTLRHWRLSKIGPRFNHYNKNSIRYTGKQLREYMEKSEFDPAAEV